MNTQKRMTRVSSLNSAAFRLVQVRDARGLTYLMRREIGTLRQLYGQPYPALVTSIRRGRLRDSTHLKTFVKSLYVHSAKLKAPS